MQNKLKALVWSALVAGLSAAAPAMAHALLANVSPAVLGALGSALSAIVAVGALHAPQPGK